MNVCIRVDASSRIGLGHIMRCLTLADYLSEENARVTFVCREMPQNMIHYIKKLGFNIIEIYYPHTITNMDNQVQKIDAEKTIQYLKQNQGVVDWLVVDHYSLNIEWEQRFRKYARRIMVIDDLANRRHDCDLLLDHNLHKNIFDRYKNLVGKECKILLGPKYMLLRREFLAAREKLRKRESAVKRLLVSFGGSDPTNETEKSLEALENIKLRNIAVDVVVGGSNPKSKEIGEICSQMPGVNSYFQSDNMAQLIVNADLGLGAGGISLLERCYLGLPTIVTVVAENQVDSVKAAEEAGVIYNLGHHTKVNADKIAKALTELIMDRHLMARISDNALQLSRFTLGEKHPVINAMLSC